MREQLALQFLGGSGTPTLDHSGFLSKLVQQGFFGDVYATPGTCDLLRVLLPDAAHLQEEEAGYANQRGYSKHKPALPLYTVEDADRALELLRRTSYSKEVELTPGVSLQSRTHPKEAAMGHGDSKNRPKGDLGLNGGSNNKKELVSQTADSRFLRFILYPLSNPAKITPTSQGK